MDPANDNLELFIERVVDKFATLSIFYSLQVTSTVFST